MSSLALIVLLAAPGLIRVQVEGDADEVVAVRDGVVWARAPVRAGRAELDGLPEARFDVQARGARTASAFARGLRPLPGRGPGFDAVLHAAPAFPVTVRTEPGARVWVDGIEYPGHVLRLPGGMHRLLVDHRERVSSAERWLRVDGPVEIEVPLEPGLVVTGVVADAAGRPVPGAFVEAFADGYPAARSGFSDAAGRFGVSGFRGDVVSIRVSAIGYAPALKRVLFYPGEERARVEVVLRPSSSVLLSILGPPAGARATLLPARYEGALEAPRLRVNYVPPQRTGRRVVFDGLRPGASYRVLVSAPGFRPKTTEAFVAPPGPGLHRVNVGLPRGPILRGTAPPRAMVVCRGPEGERSFRTGRAGAFLLNDLDPGDHVLFLRDRNEARVKVTLRAGEEMRVALAAPPPDPERAVHGSAFDADDRPLAGVRVEAAGLFAVTDEEGAFRLEGLPPGRERFALTFTPGPGCRVLAADPHMPQVERKVGVGTEVKVKLQRAGLLRLRFDPGDRPLARARLLLEGTTGVRLRRRLPRRARGIDVPDLPVGSYVAEVAAPGLLGTGGAVVTVGPAPGEPKTLTIGHGRTVRGKVILRRPVASATAAPGFLELAQERGWVRLFDGDPVRALAVAPVEADGSFLLDGLPARRVLLTAAVPGLPVASLVVDLTGGNVSGATLALEHGVEAAVKILGEDNAELPEASVRVLTEQGVDIRDLAAFGRFLGVVADDEDLDMVEPMLRLRRAGGRVTAPFLAPGSYRVLVSAQGYKPVRVGIRARSREQLGVLPGIPEVPKDWAAPIRLAKDDAETKD